MNKKTFASLRRTLSWKQEFFAMMFGMGKQAMSRLENGKRKETLAHQEMISLVHFIHEKELLAEYVSWRFGINLARRHYKKGTPINDLKYINN